MRVCAIDIGSNSVRSLVADITGGEKIHPVGRDLEITRLSENMERSGAITPAAAERTIRALEKQFSTGKRMNAQRFVVFGTYALRRASNLLAFLEKARLATGHEVLVLDGDQEAAWIYRGVPLALGAPSKKASIVDIGGGSTELIIAGEGTTPLLKSLDLGCVLLTERFIVSDPPQNAEMESLRSFVVDKLQRNLGETPLRGKGLIGAGGTITTAAVLLMGLKRYKPDTIHGCVLGLSKIIKITDLLAGISLKQRKKLPGLEERADIIIAGLIILQEVMKLIRSTEIMVSDQGILYGAVMSVVKPPRNRPL
jgi:exopolyphosphatase/guanosine-5'-triphosphate,3'-diphosphate pyrophosphatase